MWEPALDARPGEDWRLEVDGLGSRGLPVRRWAGSATPGEARALAMLSGPVLDVGCGPGRHVAWLSAHGTAAVGLDVSPAAVRLTRERGRAVIQRSVFERVPGEGAWRGVLLLDGNVGIGGDPVRLLARVRELLDEDGRALVELDHPGTPSGGAAARLVGGLGAVARFRWGVVGVDGLAVLAGRAGLRVVRAPWVDEGRWYAVLAR